MLEVHEALRCNYGDHGRGRLKQPFSVYSVGAEMTSSEWDVNLVYQMWVFLPFVCVALRALNI